MGKEVMWKIGKNRDEEKEGKVEMRKSKQRRDGKEGKNKGEE